MNESLHNYLKNEFGIDDATIRMIQSTENEIKNIFKDVESIREMNQYKVISAMQKHRLSDSHFSGTTYAPVIHCFL